MLVLDSVKFRYRIRSDSNIKGLNVDPSPGIPRDFADFIEILIISDQVPIGI